MKPWSRWWMVTLAVCAAALAAPVHAGRSCETHQPTVSSITRGLALAQKTAQALDASGADVVLLARAGQDLSKYGLRYSHLGFAYRVLAPDGGHVWRVLHKLNQCGTAEASIYRQGLGEFFLDDPWRYEAAWVALDSNAQARLLPLLQDNDHSTALHIKPYNMVSYAWGLRYQQSNQWALETLAEAIEPGAVSREQAQAWLRLKDYRPTTLQIGALTRLGGRLTAANVAFDDHPPERRFSDKIDTVTVDSIFAWLQRTGLGGAPYVVRE
ncbi:DUF2145 domain-containing protein [Caenimonas koreensis]